MKVKTYEIEVVRTSRVQVTLPETMSAEDFIESWERDLWELDDREVSIAEYAAQMAVEFPEGDHDGIGRLITGSWQKPNYKDDKYQVVAIVTDDYTEADVISEGDWKDAAMEVKE